MITFMLMSNATTRQVTTRESMLMKFVAIHCEHAFGDGGTFAKVPPSPLPGKGALTHHLHSGHSQACGLRVATHLRCPFRACSMLVAFQAPFDTGGGSPPGTCALRGGFRSLRRATGNLASLIPCTKATLLAKAQQRHFRVVTTCHWQLMGYDGVW